MNKFDHTMKLPSRWEFVKVYYQTTSDPDNGTCYEVGYWDGERWNRLNCLGNGTFHGQALKFVVGWEPLFAKE